MRPGPEPGTVATKQNIHNNQFKVGGEKEGESREVVIHFNGL